MTDEQVLRAALAEPPLRNQCGETCERAKLCATCARGIDGAEPEPDDIKAAWLAGYTEGQKEAWAEQPAEPQDPVAYNGWVLREVLFDNGEPVGHREPTKAEPDHKDLLIEQLEETNLWQAARIAELMAEPQEPVAHENSNGVVHAAGYPWSDKEVLRPLVYGDIAPQPAKQEPQQELLDLLKWLDQIGGLGLTVHARISAAIAAYERKNGIGGQE